MTEVHETLTISMLNVQTSLLASVESCLIVFSVRWFCCTRTHGTSTTTTWAQLYGLRSTGPLYFSCTWESIWHDMIMRWHAVTWWHDKNTCHLIFVSSLPTALCIPSYHGFGCTTGVSLVFCQRITRSLRPDVSFTFYISLEKLQTNFQSI